MLAQLDLDMYLVNSHCPEVEVTDQVTRGWRDKQDEHSRPLIAPERCLVSDLTIWDTFTWTDQTSEMKSSRSPLGYLFFSYLCM